MSREHDDDQDHPDLLRLVNLRREQRGQEDIHLVLARRVEEREVASGLRDRVVAVWADLEPARAEHLPGLLALESAWGERCSVVEDVAFGLGYEIGAVEARLGDDGDLDPRVADLAGMIGDVVVDAGAEYEEGVEALVAVARVLLRERRRRDVEDA